MKKIVTTLGLFILVLTTASSVLAHVPDLIPVQGTVGDADGVPINGKTDMIFEIYDANEDGELLYSSIYNSDTMQVNVDQGFFTVYLGELDAHPIDFAQLLTASQLWLQITVNKETLESRIRLASVPFAQQARTCEQIGDLEEADIQPAIGEACENGEFLRGWDHDNNEPICGVDQIGENTSAVPNWDEMVNIPGGFSDGVDNGFTTEGQLTSLLDDNYVGRSQADSVTSGMITDGTIGAADVNSSAVQIRGSKTSCDSGEYVSGIGADGNVSCENDVDTQNTYTAGSGLNLDGSTFNVNPADFFAVPVFEKGSKPTLGQDGDWATLISATINLKTPGWVIAMGMAAMRVQKLYAETQTHLCISTSTDGDDCSTSFSHTELRPQLEEAPDVPSYQQSSHHRIYFDTAGEKTIYLIGKSDDTVIAQYPTLLLYSIPAAQTD